MRPRIQTYLNSLPDSDSELLTRAEYIITNLTGNPNYPSLTTEISNLQAVYSQFNEETIAASGGDRVLIAAKNKSRAILLDVLRNIGLQVMAITPNDAAALTGSGFPVGKTRGQRTLTRPEKIRVTNGTASGQLVCKVKPAKNADLYIHEITTTPLVSMTTWISVHLTRSSNVYSKLEPGTRYWFRVGAIPGNKTAYSQIASMFAQ